MMEKKNTKVTTKTTGKAATKKVDAKAKAATGATGAKKAAESKKVAEVEKRNAVVDMLNDLKDQGYILVGLTTAENMNGFVVIDNNKDGEAVGTVVASEGEEVAVDWFDDEEDDEDDAPEDAEESFANRYFRFANMGIVNKNPMAKCRYLNFANMRGELIEANSDVIDKGRKTSIIEDYVWVCAIAACHITPIWLRDSFKEELEKHDDVQYLVNVVDIYKKLLEEVVSNCDDWSMHDDYAEEEYNEYDEEEYDDDKYDDEFEQACEEAWKCCNRKRNCNDRDYEDSLIKVLINLGVF